MIRTCFVVCCALGPVAAQFVPASLQLSTSAHTVDADLVVFELEVKAPAGIWLEHQIGHEAWVYTMEVQWMAQAADQAPALRADAWSLPNVHGGNHWAFGFAGGTAQHVPAGRYLLAMADDIHQVGRDPSPVVPTAAPTRFANKDLEIQALGYAVNPAANASLQRPPFPMHTLQPCDLVGWFPCYTQVPPTVAALAWVAGAQTDTCSGYQGQFGGPPFGFYGACSRWLVYNLAGGSSATAPVHLLTFRQDLLIGSGATLPPAIGGLGLLALSSSAGAPPLVDVDLGAAFPALLPNGGRVRLGAMAVVPLVLQNGTNLDLQFALPPSSVLDGCSLHIQSAAIDAAAGLHLSDRYELRLH